MSNFLARCTVLVLLGGGFAATGDLAWLAGRCMQLVNARSIPEGRHAAGPAVDPLPDAVVTERLRGPSPPWSAAPAAGDPPPTAGPDRVDVATLRPGDRLTLWIGRPAVAGRRVTLDIVDPAAGEALLLAPGTAARRVTIRPSRPAAPATLVAKGDSLVVTPVGTAHQARGPAEIIGPVGALTVGR